MVRISIWLGSESRFDLDFGELSDKAGMEPSFLREFLKHEDGQDMVEYSLLLAFIALAAVGILTSAGSSVQTLWNDVSNALTSATTAAS